MSELALLPPSACTSPSNGTFTPVGSRTGAGEAGAGTRGARSCALSRPGTLSAQSPRLLSSHHLHPHWQGLPWSYSDAGLGPSQLRPSQACTFLVNGSLCPNAELGWIKRGWSRLPLGVGVCTGVVAGNWSPKPFSICFLLFVPGSKLVCVCARTHARTCFSQMESGFLTAPGKSHWFSSQLKGLIILMLDPRDGIPICDSNPSLRGRILAPL